MTTLPPDSLLDPPPACADLRFGRPWYAHQTIGSTNAEARRLAEAGAPEGALVIAEEQTAGRGRAGRAWLTPPGQALAFSLILRPTLAAPLITRLSMLAGLAVCAGLEQVTPVHPLLKWPNDILLAGRKAGGLLLETAFAGPNLSYVVLGIGLNVSYVPDPAEVDFPATSVQAEAGAPVERPALLHAILQQLERRYPHLTSAALYADWHARLAWLGQWVTVRALDGDHTGYLETVTAEGSLCLCTAAGEHLEFLAGDVRLRV